MTDETNESKDPDPKFLLSTTTSKEVVKELLTAAVDQYVILPVDKGDSKNAAARVRVAMSRARRSALRTLKPLEAKQFRLSATVVNKLVEGITYEYVYFVRYQTRRDKIGERLGKTLGNV